MVSLSIFLLTLSTFVLSESVRHHYHKRAHSSKVSVIIKQNVNNFTTKRFIKLTLEEDPEWVELKDINKLLQGHRQHGYFDMTDLPIYPKLNWIEHGSVYPDTIPTSIRFREEVEDLISDIGEVSMKSFIFNFTTNFLNRLASSPQGKEAEKWLLRQIQLIANASSLPITILEWMPRKGSDPSWHYLQKTIIVRIDGSDPSSKIRKEVVILGASMDSINRHQKNKPCRNLFNCPGMIAPGADDNASGTSVLMEVFRTLAEDDFIPRKTIEFHWYAASEYGLRGSLAVASYYRERNIRVVGMLCLSQVGYSLPPSVYEPFHPSMKESLQVAVHPKETDGNLNKFLRMLVNQYLEIGWVDKIFCIGCYSDYASWTEYNFPAAFVYGWEYSPDNHRQSDVIETINFKYLMEFAKLAVAFVVEMAEPLEQISYTMDNVERR